MSVAHPERPQLRMVWPTAARRQCPVVHAAEGYSVRTFRSGDERPFLSLMIARGEDSAMWEGVCRKLGWPFTPEVWASVG